MSRESDFAAELSTDGLMRILQFGDSMFPVGGFSFSCGLESAIQQGVVIDAASLAAFARTALDQAASGDGIALVAAHRAASRGDLADLSLIDTRVYGRKLTDEMRTMSVRMGKKFAEISSEITDEPLIKEWRRMIEIGATPGCYPVSLAINFASQGLSAQNAFAVHQYGVATTILSAALRLMRIGHVETQRILHTLTIGVGDAYDEAACSRLSDMAGFAPLTEILSAVHARAHVRLFMS
jgi:urease accessory protein